MNIKVPEGMLEAAFENAGYGKRAKANCEQMEDIEAAMDGALGWLDVELEKLRAGEDESPDYDRAILDVRRMFQQPDEDEVIRDLLRDESGIAGGTNSMINYVTREAYRRGLKQGEGKVRGEREGKLVRSTWMRLGRLSAHDGDPYLRTNLKPNEPALALAPGLMPPQLHAAVWFPALGAGTQHLAPACTLGIALQVEPANPLLGEFGVGDAGEEVGGPVHALIDSTSGRRRRCSAACLDGVIRRTSPSNKCRSSRHSAALSTPRSPRSCVKCPIRVADRCWEAISYFYNTSSTKEQ